MLKQIKHFILIQLSQARPDFIQSLLYQDLHNLSSQSEFDLRLSPFSTLIKLVVISNLQNI